MPHEWINTESGILHLEDTDFLVVHDPNPHGDFKIMQGDRDRGRCMTLWFAKDQAEFYQGELEEIGVTPSPNHDVGCGSLPEAATNGT